MTSLPRIYMLIDRYLPVVGGAEVQAFALSEELHARGYRLHIVTRRIKPEFAVDERVGSVDVHRLSPTGLSHKANVLMLFSTMWYLIRHARAFDVLHVHGIGPLGIASIAAAILLRKKVLLKIASYGDLNRRDAVGIVPSRFSRLIRRVILPQWLWRWFLKQADYIVAISYEIVEEAAQAGLQKNTVYIPNGVDIEKYKPPADGEKDALREVLDLPSGPVLLFSGRLVEGKRGDVLLKALPTVLEKYPDTFAVFLGTGHLQQDSVEDKLRIMTKGLGIEEHVIFRGEVSNAADYLRCADIFVFPSQKEGLPNALLEAMACGLASVACAIGGVTDVADETTTWLLPVGDVEEFSRTLLTALSNPAETRQRGAAARQKVVERFALGATADAYVTLYTKMFDASAS